jgi:hypothetical protein
MADFIISGALLRDPALLGQAIDSGRINPNSREHSVERGWRHRDGIQQYKGEPILATACIMLSEKPNDKNIADSINIIFKSGADPYEAFNYLVNINLEYVNYFMLCINTLVEKTKEYNGSFDFESEKMTLQTLQNIQKYINPKIDICCRNIELGNPVPDYQHITEFLSGVDFDKLIEERIYRERLFDLTDKSERRGNWSRKFGYGTNNRGGLVQAVLAPVGWAVQAVAVKPVDKELEALRALRVEQLTALYLKENGYPRNQELLETEVATIQNQQIAEETAMLRQRNAMLLDRAVERQLQL